MEGEQVDARPFDFELETVDLLIQGEDLLGDLRIEARQAIHGLPNRQLGQFRQGDHVLVQLMQTLLEGLPFCGLRHLPEPPGDVRFRQGLSRSLEQLPRIVDLDEFP